MKNIKKNHFVNLCDLIRLYKLLAIIILLITSMNIYAQSTVTGTVADDNGKPLSGVTVKIKNSSTIVASQLDGHFSITGNKGDILEFTHPDYYGHELKYVSNTNIVVQLASRYLSNNNLTLDKNLTPVKKQVNILHGEQAIPDLIQSVGFVNTNQLTTTPGSQMMNALAGRIAGLNISFSNGLPGMDNSGISYNVRGSRAQTILIDGVERGYTSIDAEQIESVTVLKDALSSVMFGMRSSNGIISITTKKGESGTPRISFSAQLGFEQPTALPKPLPAWQYATLYNEAKQNDAGLSAVVPAYTSEQIAAYQNQTDSYLYPDVDWYKMVLKDNTPVNHYNFNIQGSGRGFRYFVDLDYMKEAGIFKTVPENRYNTNSDLSRYIARTNLGVDVTKTTNFQLNLFGRSQKINQPGAGTSTVLTSLLNTPQNAYPVFNPDGSLGGNDRYQQHINIWGQSVSRGYIFQDMRDLAIDLTVIHNLDFLAKGLYAKIQGSYNNTTYYTTTRQKNFAVYQYNGTQYTQYGTDTEQTTTGAANDRYRVTYIKGEIGYRQVFGKHSINALLLADRQSKLLFSSGYLPENYSTIATRIDYSFADRYSVEFAGSRGGHNWYAPAKRWANYGAFGLSWNIHNEKFMQDLSFVNILKPRFTYGLTGRANVDYYTWMQTYTLDNMHGNYSRSYWWGNGGSLQRGSSENALTNPNLEPEKAKKTDIGIDMNLADNRLIVIYDYFYNKYYDIVATPNYTSPILGTAYPAINYQKFDYYGNEITVTWQDKIKNFNYFISGNLSLIQSKVVYNQELAKDYEYQSGIGKPVGIRFGYIVTGLFKSYEEINDEKNAILSSVSRASLRPGDIRYEDRNNDGIINANDQGVIGSEKPNMYYGINLGFNYKGLDFSILLQGTINRTVYLNGDFMNGFGNGGMNNAYEYNMGRFTHETAETAKQPRLWIGSNTNNTQTSTFWQKDADFIRLKNMEIGYTFPTIITRKIGIPSVKLFVNGLNILTSSELFNVRKDLDPEAWGASYPIMKTFNFGISVKL
ncbi:TonB-dependent receptor SusC [termite gut metagenome]|uniref:TonB-dependent receptor SusC n=1 Tax=termite gut metagenome TaxID=433724 RepID=A0A5J4SUN0_9ZZZZ